jgi:hypothetical protein
MYGRELEVENVETRYIASAREELINTYSPMPNAQYPFLLRYFFPRLQSVMVIEQKQELNFE